MKTNPVTATHPYQRAPEVMDLLTVSDVSRKNQDQHILRSISFSQQRFQHIAIAGETGSGKSTLMKIIAGLVNPDEGAVYFNGEKLKKVPDEKLIPGHKGIAYLSQHFELPHFLRVEQALQYSNELSEQEAGLIYEICRISRFLKRRTDQLSGGESQRIALAKLLISSPQLLILDEPFSNIDLIQKNTLKSVIEELSETLNITCIMVSHDPLDTLSWAHEIKVMRGGNIIQQGPPAQVYFQPLNEYTAGLFGQYNIINPLLAHAFIPSLTMGSIHQKFIIRPEHFRITSDPNDSIPGVVQDLVFYGSYQDVRLQVADTILTVRTGIGMYSPGDRLFVTVCPEHIHAV